MAPPRTSVAPGLAETPLLETPLLETPLLETPLLETPVREAARSGSSAPGGQPGLRVRVSRAIDRWAEREEAAQRRLESMILPKRWQT
jgi:hypothetical protein